MYTDLHAWSKTIHDYIGQAVVDAKSTIADHVKSLQRVETHIVERIPFMEDHTHPRIPELPVGGQPGDVLTIDENGLCKWAQPADTWTMKIDRLKALIEASDMNNKEKLQIISTLNDYWLNTHPDCFIEQADGRKTFRPDLLDYKQDMMLRDVYASKAEIPAPVVTEKQKTWPLWLAIGLLTVMEIAQIVSHI